MKNILPVIIAVLLGVAAVLAVRSLLSKTEAVPEETVGMAIAAQDIPKGTTIRPEMIGRTDYPASKRPKTGISAREAQLLYGQKADRDIPLGDLILSVDIREKGRLAEQIRSGYWATPLPVDNPEILSLIVPGDEIAIISTFEILTTSASANAREEAKQTRTTATVTLFPQVRVLSLGEGLILVELKPDQAQALISAQSSQRLSIALRRTADDTFPARQQSGMVTPATFTSLLTNSLKTVVIPLTKDELDKNQSNEGK